MRRGQGDAYAFRKIASADEIKCPGARPALGIETHCVLIGRQRGADGDIGVGGQRGNAKALAQAAAAGQSNDKPAPPTPAS